MTIASGKRKTDKELHPASVRFVIVIVCLNPGEKLQKTVSSVTGQTFADYDILLQDGCSTDGSVEALRLHALEHGYADRLHTFREKDSGIYDAMNRAIGHAGELAGETERFYLFLNCGDSLRDSRVLERAARGIEATRGGVSGQRDFGAQPSGSRLIAYGDRYLEPTGQVESSPARITAFQCYRNIPCHQVCFYSEDCFDTRLYEPKYRIRADYEHFLWCYFRGRARFVRLKLCVANYEGGGYSETPESVRRSAAEHEEIARIYFSGVQRLVFKGYLVLSLQPLRHRLATDERFAKSYQAVVRMLRRG